ncbi:MAG TPA: SAM-dependent methyltransferase [Terriglobales bacterium]|nr:SAM-dependent methyltransferase [Terriglobales bacterium]
MSSVTSNIFRLFRGDASPSPAALAAQPAVSERIPRRSSGFAEFARAIAGRDSLCVLDLGPTSPANITHLTGLGHRSYNEDVLLASFDSSLAMTSPEGKPTLNAQKFLADNLAYERELFDAVLLWDMPDYLHESLVKPVVERLHYVMKPGGVLLAFFHTRDAGPDAPFYRYHIAPKDGLSLQPVWKPMDGLANGRRTPMFRLQRVFNNRHIENLFRDFGSLKFFLARDNVREVLVVR